MLIKSKVSDIARYEVEQLIFPLSSLVSLKPEHLKTPTQDSRLKFNYQVADLGGTLGLFVGFSFLGLFDALVNILCSVFKVFIKGSEP